MKLKVLGLTALLALTAGLIAACGGAATNTSNANHSNTVTNLGANNANTGAVVVNANSNANVSTNRWNPNITREEYEKNKGDYEKEKGSSTIGQGANDMWLWVKTRAKLMDDAKIVRVITKGRTGMPAFGNKLNANQISAIAKYVRGL